VQPERIALVGHSEGALVALLVARDDPRVWVLGLLGAASRPGREVARWQRATLVAGDLTTWPPAQRAAVLARAESDADAIAATDPWLRTWFSLDPRAIARDVRQPGCRTPITSCSRTSTVIRAATCASRRVVSRGKSCARSSRFSRSRMGKIVSPREERRKKAADFRTKCAFQREKREKHYCATYS
jgi:pimeloyl-ACP methyl ester carboxylesterase